MSSAIPYDPDDFDNNPFADGDVGSLPYQAQQVEESNSEQQQDDAEAVAEAEDDSQESHSVGNTSTASVAAIQQEEGIISPSTGATDSGFSDFPTELDLKKYVPERLNKDRQLVIKIQEIESNGNNTHKNPIFKFNAKVVKLGGYRKPIYKNVRRTYKEVESLYKFLMYNNIEVFVPSLPKIPTLFTPMSPEFVSSLTFTFQDWFNRICFNPILMKNKEFALFFEQSDFGYVPSKTKPSTNSVIATGLKRKTLKQFQPPYDSCEDLARYRPMIKEVHLNCTKLYEKLEKYIKYQRQAGYYGNEFLTQLGELANMESNEDMSKLWKRFFRFTSMFNESDLIKNLSLTAELLRFFGQVRDDTYNIKEALTNRHLLMRELINAEEATKKKHSAITKLKMKSTIDPIRVDEAIRNLEMSSNYQKELRYQVKRTTYEMLIESKEYSDYLVLNFKKFFHSLTKQQILQERKKLNLLINNRLINHSESLGRLGRENLPDSVVHQKQPSDQDSWNSRAKKSYSDSSMSESSTMKESLSEQLSSIDAKSAASLLAGSNF